MCYIMMCVYYDVCVGDVVGDMCMLCCCCVCVVIWVCVMHGCVSVLRVCPVCVMQLR